MSEAAAYTLGAMDPAAIRELLTPEGVPLRLGMARGGARFAAFGLDVLLILGSCAVVWIVCGLIGFLALGEWAIAVAFVVTFLIRNFYMSFFEIATGGATPGKKINRLRVVDRRGGALTAEAVFARNLTREVEFWGPLIVLLSPTALWPGAPAWAALVATVWLVAFAVVPFFSTDRLRLGDLIAGTMVVELPRTTLLKDLSASSRDRRTGALGFSQEQLDVYGIFELQVLEELLRATDADKQTIELVAKKIKRKIGWDDRAGPPVPARAFLRAFYDAQRGRLEGKLLMGERKERKGTGRRVRRSSDDDRPGPRGS